MLDKLDLNENDSQSDGNHKIQRPPALKSVINTKKTSPAKPTFIPTSKGKIPTF